MPVRRVVVAITVAALFCGPTVALAQADSADPLLGLWASETTFGPAARGTLTLERDGAEWRALIAGIRAPVRVTGDSVRFALPGGLGEFRGTRAPDGRAIAGFWIQPLGVTLGQSYATPVTLSTTAPGVWRGDVVPLDDRFSLYLSVSRRADGSLQGVFRNPEFNSYGRWLRFLIVRDRDAVRFTVPADDDQAEIRLTGTLDSAHRQLTIWWPDLERPLVLTPIAPDQAIGLYPRVPRRQAYRYHAPVAVGDGWQTGRAAPVGLNEAALAGLVQRIVDTEPTLNQAPLIHSLLVARHGRLVLEEYFSGFDRERVHDTRSAAKTFASVMLGAEMLRGAPIAPESSVYALLRRYAPFANPDPRKARITVAHLLTHSTGLACDDNDDASPGNENTMQLQTAQPDWWKYALDLPQVNDPGARYAYCSATMNLVGAALTAASQTWLPSLFDQTIARPLQFGPYHYNLLPTLEGYAGGGVQLRPRDLLKVGQLYLDGGVWHGRRVVPASWVARSTTNQVPASAGNPDGYAWHLNTLHSGGHDYREYEANGNGGQMLIVVPALDLVIVFTAGNYGHGGVWHWFRDRLVPDVIIPAIQP